MLDRGICVSCAALAPSSRSQTNVIRIITGTIRITAGVGGVINLPSQPCANDWQFDRYVGRASLQLPMTKEAGASMNASLPRDDFRILDETVCRRLQSMEYHKL